MRFSPRHAALAGVLATGFLAFGTNPAKAQVYVVGGGYPVPSYNYYGNGGHDFQPHWHTTQTPFSSYSYYGLGRHDFRPHAHTETPYGITSYNGGFYSNTQSHAPPSPYVGGYSGGGYGVPSSNYYGNGGHDFQPHWHTTQTPFGSYSYYGLGRHDFRPHDHVETPSGITSYSNGPFSNTQSYSPPAPYIYRPW
jgi:hypothetical protein